MQAGLVEEPEQHKRGDQDAQGNHRPNPAMRLLPVAQAGKGGARYFELLLVLQFQCGLGRGDCQPIVPILWINLGLYSPAVISHLVQAIALRTSQHRYGHQKGQKLSRNSH